MTEIETVEAIFAAISDGEAERAIAYMDAERFVQHNPYAEDGVSGLRHFIAQAPSGQLHLEVVRALEDGPFVVTQARGKRSDRNVFFDVFRFDHELVVEHWAFSTDDGPPNPGGHTQLDGPAAPAHLEETEANKQTVRRYYETFHIGGDHSGTERYFDGDLMIRHEPGVQDGVQHFLADVAELMKHRTIDEIKLLLGQGDLVFVAAKGTHEQSSCVYIDLYRVEGGKLVEHWGFPEAVPPPAQCKNANGML